MDEQNQICSICKVEKSIDNFYFRKTRNNYRTQCKICLSVRGKQYCSENKEKISIRRAKYYQNNKEKILIQTSKWYQNNKERINEWERGRRKTDENYRLIKNTRRRIYSVLNDQSKSLRTREILGVDDETYKRWIEHQMTPEMNFNNIHIDHVKPISSFDISNDNELLEAFNWRNTQPLLKQDNLRKSNKYNEQDYLNQFIKARKFINSLVIETVINTFLNKTSLL